MEWKPIAIGYGVLLVAGTLICIAFTFFTCEKVGVLESLKQGAIFAIPGGLVPVLVQVVPAVGRPFENVLRDTFGVAADKAPMLGTAYLMMLVSWIMGARAVGNIRKTVCIPTPDEVAEFKAHLQKKVAKEEKKEEKRNEALTKTA